MKVLFLIIEDSLFSFFTHVGENFVCLCIDLGELKIEWMILELTSCIAYRCLVPFLIYRIWYITYIIVREMQL